jgi:hypothetical protein
VIREALAKGDGDPMIRAWLRRFIRDHAPPVAESFTSYRGSELAELAGALRRHPERGGVSEDEGGRRGRDRAEGGRGRGDRAVEGEESMSEDVSEILVTVANLREERKMLLGALDGVLGRSERTLGEGHQEQDRALQEICGIARAAFQSAREPWKPTPEGLLSRIEADGHVLTFDPPLRVEQGRNYRMKVTLKGPVGGPSFPDLASQAVLRESRAEQINELLSAARDAVSSGADAPPLALVMERLRSVIASMDAHSPTQGAAVAGPAPCRCGHVGAEACLLSGPPPPAVAGPACACSQPGEPRSRCGGLAAGDCPCACHEEDASKAATGPAPGCPTCGQLCPLIVGGHYVCTRPLPHAYAPEEVLGVASGAVASPALQRAADTTQVQVLWSLDRAGE